MNRNQKIALGCGGAGCLGLIVLLVVGGVLYMLYWNRSGVFTANRNSNYNINRNSNSSASPDSATNSSDSPSSSMSDDDKHKLFQAAGAANDFAVMQKVMTKIGLFKSDGSPTEEYAGFVRDHISWMLRNSDFIQTIDTPEKARAYVEEHIDD